MKHPIRLEICKLLDMHASLTTREIRDLLMQSHPGEKQVYAADEHVLSLRAVGIAELVEEWVEDAGEGEMLMQRWRLTTFGREKYRKYW